MTRVKEDISAQKPLAPTTYGMKRTALKKKSATAAARNRRMVSSCDISLSAEIGIVPDMWPQAVIATISTPRKVRLKSGKENW